MRPANWIIDAGLSEFAQALARNTTLKELNMTSAIFPNLGSSS
jgi:hypothetical protein